MPTRDEYRKMGLTEGEIGRVTPRQSTLGRNLNYLSDMNGIEEAVQEGAHGMAGGQRRFIDDMQQPYKKYGMSDRDMSLDIIPAGPQEIAYDEPTPRLVKAFTKVINNRVNPIGSAVQSAFDLYNIGHDLYNRYNPSQDAYYIQERMMEEPYPSEYVRR